MPALIKLLLRHALTGFALAVVFVQVLIANDVTGLGTLVAKSEIGDLAVFVLTAFMGLTFASVQMGIAVMLASREDDEDGDRGSFVAALGDWFLKPVRVIKNERRR
ncbi:MAG: hypothetical protein AB7I12_15035 [Steroidobacteraceae bacterium]